MTKFKSERLEEAAEAARAVREIDRALPIVLLDPKLGTVMAERARDTPGFHLSSLAVGSTEFGTLIRAALIDALRTRRARLVAEYGDLVDFPPA